MPEMARDATATQEYSTMRDGVEELKSPSHFLWQETKDGRIPCKGWRSEKFTIRAGKPICGTKGFSFFFI